ncbi:MAG: hypothetical protein QM528_09445 [Phycisphaerales bacterium]|nr:hypothetical protein [Phycisphaerales bacterium]
MKIKIHLLKVGLSLFFIVAFFYISFGNAFDKISYDNQSNVTVVSIVFNPQSTLVFMQYKNDGATSINIDKNIYLQDKSNNRKYNLLHSINLPLAPAAEILNTSTQLHNFVLEFESVDTKNQGDVFNIIETQANPFSIYNIKIDTTKPSANPQDVRAFIANYPVKEYGTYYKDGNTIHYYKYKGINISATLVSNNDYGKYYQIDLSIKNLSGDNVDLNPNLAHAYMIKGKDTVEQHILTDDEYIRKVNRKQFWNAFGNSLNESFAASNAGYSSSTSSSASTTHTNVAESSSGYATNGRNAVYGSENSNSSINQQSYGSSYTENYDGTAAYYAQQNANRNIAAYNQHLYSIKQTLANSYIKLNTISNESEYLGYMNISYKKMNQLIVDIPLLDTDFYFAW